MVDLLLGGGLCQVAYIDLCAHGFTCFLRPRPVTG
jgi:hypothetical protein